MPKRVEHSQCPLLTASQSRVVLAGMPKGVEHEPTASNITVTLHVVLAVMPKGVENKYLVKDAERDKRRTSYFQTVRGAFVEGDPVYEGARIHAKTHVQIAVRDPSCILGYFRPAASYTGD